MKKLFAGLNLFMIIVLNSILLNNFSLNANISLAELTHDVRENVSAPAIKAVSSWETIFEQQKNRVVQVFSYSVDFDWDMPFRRGEMHHSRGSGFVVSPDGEIYTNFHVVDDAEVLFVQLPATGKERFEVEFLGGCPEYDCARLKIKPSEFDRLKTMLGVQELDCVTLGDSDCLKENQEVMLIGYPLGHENVNSTTGRISGRQEGPKGGGEWFTTTAASNHGNSGGPISDINGNVIGILVAGIDGANGIAFLIPINSVKKIMPECVNGRVVRAPYWGMNTRPTTQATLKFLNVPGTNGILVVSVGKQSLADRAGLQASDVIVGINGYDVDRFGYLSVPWAGTRVEFGDMLARYGNNETLTFSVFRNGTKIDCSVALSFDLPFVVQECYPTFQEKPKYEVFGGMVFMELTKNHLVRLSPYLHMAVEKKMLHPMLSYLSADKLLTSRLCISHIFPETDLAKSSALTSRDLVVASVNGIPVNTLDDLRNAVLQYDKETFFCNVTTESGVTFALFIPEVLMQDPQLAHRYGYESSALMGVLFEQMQILSNSIVG